MSGAQVAYAIFWYVAIGVFLYGYFRQRDWNLDQSTFGAMFWPVTIVAQTGKLFGRNLP